MVISLANAVTPFFAQYLYVGGGVGLILVIVVVVLLLRR